MPDITIVKNINTVHLRLAESQERLNNFDLSSQAIGKKNCQIIGLKGKLLRSDLIKDPSPAEEKRIKTIQDRIAAKTKKNDEVMSKRLKNLFA